MVDPPRMRTKRSGEKWCFISGRNVYIIWYPARHTPLSIVSTDSSGDPSLDRVLLSERESTITVDTSKPFKLNGGNTGVCTWLFNIHTQKDHMDVYHPDRVLYTPERLVKIAEEAGKDRSIFSLEDRIGLVSDAMVLAKASLSKTSGALTLIDLLRVEKECECLECYNGYPPSDNLLVLGWKSISMMFNEMADIFWEDSDLVDRLCTFKRVRKPSCTFIL